MSWSGWSAPTSPFSRRRRSARRARSTGSAWASSTMPARRSPRGGPSRTVPGIAYRQGDRVRFTPPRPPIEDMDALPFVVDVYRRDLTIEHYFIGYLLHPYVSLYTGRGCRSKCTFCLWPQTVGGHRYRVRSPESVEAEMALAKRYFPQVREFFFDDDTFTDDLPRAEEIARRLGRLGLTWSCNAKANVPRRTLEVLRDNGLRLLLVGYESGDQRILNNIKKGVRLDVAREFTRERQGPRASPSTGPSSWACRERRRRRSGRRSATRVRSSPTPSRSRSRRRTPGPRSTGRRRSRGGSRRRRGAGEPGRRAGGRARATRASRSRRSSIPSRRSIAASTSGRGRSSRWPAACCGTRPSCADGSARASSSSGSCGTAARPRRTARPAASSGGGAERRTDAGAVRLPWQRLSEPGGRADLPGPDLERRRTGGITRRARPASIRTPGGRLITKRDVAWADVICVMEPEHEAYIRKHWPEHARKVRVLGIPDIYEPDDAELRDRLTGWCVDSWPKRRAARPTSRGPRGGADRAGAGCALRPAAGRCPGIGRRPAPRRPARRG